MPPRVIGRIGIDGLAKNLVVKVVLVDPITGAETTRTFSNDARMTLARRLVREHQRPQDQHRR